MSSLSSEEGSFEPGDSEAKPKVRDYYEQGLPHQIIQFKCLLWFVFVYAPFKMICTPLQILHDSILKVLTQCKGVVD